MDSNEIKCWCGVVASAKIHDDQSDHFEHGFIDPDWKPAGSRV